VQNDAGKGQPKVDGDAASTTDIVNRMDTNWTARFLTVEFIGFAFGQPGLKAVIVFKRVRINNQIYVREKGVLESYRATG